MMKFDDGVLITFGTILLIASLAIGAIVGAFINFESKMEHFAVLNISYMVRRSVCGRTCYKCPYDLCRYNGGDLFLTRWFNPRQ